MYSIKEAKSDILREASLHGNQICRLKNASGEFVKVKRGYSQPDELRLAFLSALDELLTDGSVKQVFNNRVLEFYEAKSPLNESTTLLSIKDRIMREIAESGHVYKIHSPIGEFVQLGNQSFEEPEHERIVYMEALGALLHHGAISVANETAEMTVFVPPAGKNILGFELQSMAQSFSSQQAVQELKISLAQITNCALSEEFAS